MKKIGKKLKVSVSAVLAAAILAAMTPVAAFAADGDELTVGADYSTLEAAVNDSGVITYASGTLDPAVEAFIRDSLAGVTKVSEINADNYLTILNSTPAYSQLSGDQKDKLDEYLQSKGGNTYAELKQGAQDFQLAQAQALAEAKTNATSEIYAKADAAVNAIIGNSALSLTQKDKFKKDIADARNAALPMVDNASTLSDVQTVVDSFTNTTLPGIIGDNGTVKALTDAMAQAKNAVEATRDASYEVIDNMPSLSDSDRTNYKDRLDQAAEDAIAQLGELTEPSAIIDAGHAFGANDDAAAALNDASDLSDAKSAAKEIINNKADAAKTDLDAMSSLTDEGRQNYKDWIGTAVEKANDSVDAAISTTDAAAVGNNFSVADIIARATAENLKNAKDAAEESASKAIADITNDARLTDADKKTLNKLVSDAKDAFDAAVANTTDAAAVNDAKNTFDAAIKAADDKTNGFVQVNLTACADENADGSLTLTGGSAKIAIDNLKNLTDADRNGYYTDLANAAKASKDAILAGSPIRDTLDDFYAKADTGADSIVAKAKIVDALRADTAAAIESINAKAAEAAKTIGDLQSLTDAERDAYLKTINDEADKAKQTVYSVTTVAEANKAASDYTSLADQTVAEATLKNSVCAASAQVTDKANEALAAIGKATLTDAQKTALTDAVTKARDAALGSIQKATTTADAETAAADGVAALIAIVKPIPAMEFINKTLRADLKSELYDSINSKNADQIYGGKTEFDALDDETKATVDQLIKDGSKYANYYAYLNAVARFAAESANKFIGDYLTKADGTIVTEANRSTCTAILNGQDVWDKMSQTEKDAVDARLKAASGPTYEELLATAKNYANSNSSNNTNKDDASSSTNAESTTDQPASSKAAAEVKHFASPAASSTAAKGVIPQTGDASNPILWVVLMLVSGTAGAVVFTRKKRLDERDD